MQHPTASRQRHSQAIGYHAQVRLAMIILTLTVETQAQWDIRNSPSSPKP